MVFKAIESVEPGLYVTADDIYPLMKRQPNEPNAVGSAFRLARQRGLLQGTERFVLSERPEARGRRIQVWYRL